VIAAAEFRDELRRQKSAAFDLEKNSTAQRVVSFPLWGKAADIYANANLSIYSAQKCNARCPFCVEELRPASRGVELIQQKEIERSDKIYFAALEETLAALRPLNPSVSITGGEPSKDPRLPQILRVLQQHEARKLTLTTNGSGLLDVVEGRPVIDWIAATGVRHLNISRAHPETARNSRLMGFEESLTHDEIERVVNIAKAAGTRMRLSCVLLEGETDSLEDVVGYIEFARRVGIDNVIFRQLMKVDSLTVQRNFVVQYSDRSRVPLEPILDAMSADDRFEFVRQIVGYYYYVEVWRYGNIDVVFEEADLAQLETAKRATPGIIHELIFHPNARLASTWQPWDGVLEPR
jgi:cyclic pyranopterin phosphate synthase